MSDAIYDGLHLGDCLEVMKRISDESVDMVLADLPYQTTQNNWDFIIPFDLLWEQYWRIAKPNAAIVLTAAQPFTTALIASQIDKFRYCLVWDKKGTTGFQLAKKQPLRRHEDICLFYRKQPTYNPIMETRGEPRKKGGSKADNGCYGDLRSAESFNNTYYPTSIVDASNASKVGLIHPTQKPVALFEYLIRTYTDEGMTVLDNTAGSGTTAIAAINAKRNWICIERDPEYYAKAKARIEDHINKMELF
jgi:site-specific DNA-methyltransferase (adenine-specific)